MIEGKTATLCPCFHLVCSYSPLEKQVESDSMLRGDDVCGQLMSMGGEEAIKKR